MKNCSRCKIEKSLVEFYIKRFYSANPANRREIDKKYGSTLKGTCSKASCDQNRRNKKLNNLLPKVKQQTLIDEYEAVDGSCYNCGQKTVYYYRNNQRRKEPDTLSWDKLDSKKGYVIGNRVVSCWMCNIGKFDYS